MSVAAFDADPKAYGYLSDVFFLQSRMFSGFLYEHDRWPHYVHYSRNKVRHTPPDAIFIGKLTGPSDCEWIVPQTWKRL